MKPKTYEILCRCIEEGLLLGMNRAHKHTDTPKRNAILTEQETAILATIHEVFRFEEIAE